jgi:hypothetical protein
MSENPSRTKQRTTPYILGDHLVGQHVSANESSVGLGMLCTCAVLRDSQTVSST